MKPINEGRTATDGGAWSAFSEALGNVTPLSTTWAPTSSYRVEAKQIHPKAVEAYRQIDRLREVALLNANLVSTDCKALTALSVGNSISLINAMINGPIPIPVTGRGDDGGTALFFDVDGFYGDVEINGDYVEYFLKLRDPAAGAEDEYIGKEEIKDGRIPPNLLSRLYRNFARTKRHADLP